MNTEEDETEHKDKTEWSSFEQYEDSNRLKPEWDLQSIEQIIWKLHPSDEKQCNENGDPFEEPLIFKDISFFISDCTKCSECDNDNSTKNTQSYWNSGIKNENFKMSCSYLCELLKYSSIRKKYINHRTASWKKYIDLLPLKTIENNNVAIKKACNSSPCISPLASDASDSEESDIDIADPMYSKFAVLRKNGFYISEDGLVFCNPYELEEYNRKMMGMSQVLQDELDFITAQHQALKLVPGTCFKKNSRVFLFE
ncbi:predicted protein [Nematostella vectensis]|uniref:Uncharacterized protein n=1 Tax=Nematostella vectensis TaxID=45351 RepID=A7SX98_NEMVE|nr:predicted protein [Nematostella vectensis]|eukprot:XP_001623768.1 predicted protein [Nematostella vectensis]